MNIKNYIISTLHLERTWFEVQFFWVVWKGSKHWVWAYVSTGWGRGNSPPQPPSPTMVPPRPEKLSPPLRAKPGGTGWGQ